VKGWNKGVRDWKKKVKAKKEKKKKPREIMKDGCLGFRFKLGYIPLIWN
jgi:hypothetical protein